MLRKIIIAAASSAVVALSSAAFAQQSEKVASGAEAKEMLQNAVDAVALDNQKAFDMFNKGEGGFLYRDSYVFCSNVGDGKFVAMGNPNAKELLGQDVRSLKDATGKPFGQELYAAGQKPEGEITEVDYLFAKPTDPKPVPKASFVTRVGDVACGVGYYK
jgi:signal transduction histidine kinase